MDSTETVDDRSRKESAETVAGVPTSYAECLLRTSVEGNRDHGEQRYNSLGTGQ